MKKREILLIFTTVWLVFPAVILAQFGAGPVDQQQQLSELNTRMMQAGERGQHESVEGYMRQMIDLMGQMEYPADEVRQRAHLLIQYSQSVNRLLPARDAALWWLGDHPDDLQAREMLAEITYRMGRYQEAKEAMEKVYAADKGNPSLQRRYLKILVELHDGAEAGRVCEAILAASGNDAQAMREVVEAGLAVEQPELARKALAALKSLQTDAPYIAFSEARIAQAEGEFKAAADRFASVPESAPFYYESLFRQGICRFRLQEFESAARRFVELLTINPDDRQGYTQLEQCLARLRKTKGLENAQAMRTELEQRYAIADEASSIQRQGNAVEAARLHALVFSMQGQYQRAQETLRSAAASSPGSLPAQKNLAEHYVNTLQARHAEEIYRKLLDRVSPEDRTDLTVTLMKVQLLQGKTDEPLHTLNAADQASSLFEQLRILLGTYYLEIAGDPAQAMTFFEGALTATKPSRAAHARALLESGRYAEAYELFDTIPGDFEDPLHWFSYAACLAKLDRVEEAQRLYSETLAKYPATPAMKRIHAEAAIAAAQGAENAGDLQREADRLAETLQSIRTLVAQANRGGWERSAPVFLQLADIYSGLDEPDMVKRYALLAYSADPSNEIALKKIIECLSSPIDLFNRLYHIQEYQEKFGSSATFADETRQSLSYLELEIF